MTRRTARRIAALAAVLLVPGLHAQPVARIDTAQLRSFTIGSLLTATSRLATLARADTVATTRRALVLVDSLLAVLQPRGIGALPLALVLETPQRLGTGPRASFAAVARWRRQTLAPTLGDGDAAALQALATLTLADLRFAVERRQPAVSLDTVDAILAPYAVLQAGQLTRSIATSLEKLNRYERKYGPAAPRLNLAEVGLNYVLQFVPGIGPSSDGWPSRWEGVASYVPTYLTMTDSRVRAVTVAEVGVRAYLWRRGWGGEAGGLLRPGYLSAGVALAGAQDGAFVSPLRGTARVGGFVGWGETKVAFIGGRDRRVLITRQLQVVPWVF